jgi:Secretion system C-terminal sorting domain
MKKIFLSAVVLLFTIANIQGKIVKFIVDMDTAYTPGIAVHVMGDFQVIAGAAPINFTPDSCLMKYIGGTKFEYTVKIPAFTKYEYIFVKGNSYESEYVPYESRVDYVGLPNSNRWFYLDSINNDTTIIGDFIFSTNAPVGKKIVRFLVDMRDQPTGVSLPHVKADFNSFSDQALPMYSFGNKVYDMYTYVESGAHEFRFTNQIAQNEVIWGACKSINANRNLTVTNDTVLGVVCFNACIACYPLSIQNLIQNQISISPNPAIDVLHIANTGLIDIQIFDNIGRSIMHDNSFSASYISINAWPSGIYFVKINNTPPQKIIKL